jgi:hypothetical protein
MKNKNPLFYGILIAIAFLFVINGLLNSLFLFLVDINIESYSIGIAGLNPLYTLSDSTNNYTSTVLLLFPVIINMVLIELAIIFLSKSKVGTFRKTIIAFALLIIGYVIVFVFYGLIELILAPNSNSLWLKITVLWQLEGNQIFVFVFFVIVVLFAYMQVTQKRILQYLVEYKSK